MLIVSSRVGTPLFQGNPPFFLGTLSFWSKFKKLPPSFWEPPKLVHANCTKHFKIKELHIALYKVNWEYHYHYSLYFQAQLCIYYKTKIHPNIFRYISTYILSCRIKKKRKKLTYELWKHTKCLTSGSI